MSKSFAYKTGYERCQQLQAFLLAKMEEGDLPAPSTLSLDDVKMTTEQAKILLTSQLTSRLLDNTLFKLKRDGKASYNIGSAGHESVAAVSAAFSVTDIAFLHYRSRAFLIQRALTLSGLNNFNSIITAFLAKIRGVVNVKPTDHAMTDLLLPPQTSTIASHLPKAVGMAASIKRAQLLAIEAVVSADSVVICSFGDASVNHACAQSAFNTADWIVHHHYPLPIVFVCEDNGFGISVRTPPDWIEHQFKQRKHLHYIAVDGCDMLAVYLASQNAANYARQHKKPVFLHIKCVRLLGHAGSDYEIDYRELAEMEDEMQLDPILYSISTILDQNVMTREEIISLIAGLEQQIADEIEGVVDEKELKSASALKAPIIPSTRACQIPATPTSEARQACFMERWSLLDKPMNMAQQINMALIDIMLQYPNVIVFGEDVGVKGGVYQLTRGLQQRFSQARVFDTLLDETTILGQAIGYAHNGFLPIVEIQYLAYFHNAEDQLRSEAATLSFFSSGEFSNPMIIRIPSFAYQKGMGGHFHNDNSISVFRDLPGVIIACPSNGVDAAKMLRQCVELAYLQQRIVVFLEPIALYYQKDLYQEGDGLLLNSYPNPPQHILLGEMGVYGTEDKANLIILTYGNGVIISQHAALILEQHDVVVKIIDLRWLAPLDYAKIIAAIGDTDAVLVVDECRRTGSLGEALIGRLATQITKHFALVAAEDSYLPTGPTCDLLLPSEEKIVEAAQELLLRDA